MKSTIQYILFTVVGLLLEGKFISHDEGGTHKYRHVLRMGISTNFKFFIVKKGHDIMHNSHKLYFSIY